METQQRPPCREQTQMTNAINKKDIYKLSSFFAEDIAIGNYIHGGEYVIGKEKAIEFFTEFFKPENHTKDELLLFYRIIDNGMITGILDRRFIKYYPEYDFILFIEDCKIVKIEVFKGIVSDVELMNMLDEIPDGEYDN